MLGQVYSPENKLYNIVILAGGAGSRMGNASEFIPKALTKIGRHRAIYHIINRYNLIAHKFIVGSGYHSDLLESYVKGSINDRLVVFSRENPKDMKNDGLSTIHCLDHADCRYGTIIIFCDLLMLGNFKTVEDSILIADKNTEGILGTFRNSVREKNGSIEEFISNDTPVSIDEDNNGILGYFTIKDTPLLKHIAYGVYNTVEDLTNDIIKPYMMTTGGKVGRCEKAVDFGTELELNFARSYWEKIHSEKHNR